MIPEITHNAFFGDQPYDFTLTDDMVAELERKVKMGVGLIYAQMSVGDFNIGTPSEIIRLGLIGAGMPPARAAEMIDTYVRNRPLDEIEPLAFAILDCRWNGAPKAEAAA